MVAALAWLLVVEGHPKHGRLGHPLAALVLALSFVWVCSSAAHDWSWASGGDPRDRPTPGDLALALALAAYWTALCALRLPTLGGPQVLTLTLTLTPRLSAQ